MFHDVLIFFCKSYAFFILVRPPTLLVVRPLKCVFLKLIWVKICVICWSGDGFTKQENTETIISPRILLLSWWTILFRPILREKKNLAPFSIGRNKIVHQENKNFLGEIIVSFFSCFVNPFPGLNCRDLLSHSNIQFSVPKCS